MAQHHIWARWFDRRWHILMAILVLSVLDLILWTAANLWQRSCSASQEAGPFVNIACPSILLNGALIGIALSLWAIGLVGWHMSWRDARVAFFVLSAGSIAANILATTGNQFGAQLFYLLLAWLAPVTVHAHLAWLGGLSGTTKKLVVGSLYSLALLWSLPLLFWAFGSFDQPDWLAHWLPSVRLNLALAFALIVLLVIRECRRPLSQTSSRRARRFALGFILTFTLSLSLFAWPAIRAASNDPSDLFLFFWLVPIPLAYSAILVRGRTGLVKAWRDYSAASYPLVPLLISVHLLIAIVLYLLPTHSIGQWLVMSAVLSIGLLSIQTSIHPRRRHLSAGRRSADGQTIINRIARMAATLTHTPNRDMLRRLLVDELTLSLRLSGSVLLLRDRRDALAVIGSVGFDAGANPVMPIPIASHIARYLSKTAAPTVDSEVRNALRDLPLGPAEQNVCALPNIAVWAPLVSRGQLYGLLLIGARHGQIGFTTQEMSALAILVYQSAMVAHNLWLATQIQNARRLLARAQQHVWVAREQEQRHLARELHDGPLQQLLGMSYQLVELQRRSDNTRHSLAQDDGAFALEALRREVLDIARQLRRQLRELRPAALKEFGLATALEQFVARLNQDSRSTTPAITFDLDRQAALAPEPVALCLFRVAQEAVQNARRHAQADHIHMRLQVNADEAILCVQDDGRGFAVPTQFSKLAHADHFGLIGMTERVTGIGGQLMITSQPGEGTVVTVRAPLRAREVYHE